MIDLKKDKIFRPAKVTLAGWQYQSAADAMEREQVLAHLERALDEYSDDHNQLVCA